MEASSWLARCNSVFREGRTASSLPSSRWEVYGYSALPVFAEGSHKTKCTIETQIFGRINVVIALPSGPGLQGIQADVQLISISRQGRS